MPSIAPRLHQQKQKGRSFAMITVNVWLPQGKNVGHASMELATGEYISWWPHLAPGSTLPDPSTLGGKAKFLTTDFLVWGDSREYPDRTFETDKKSEGGREPRVVLLFSLDELKIRSWWAQFGLRWGGHLLAGPLPSWNTLNRNCATVVALALTVGGGEQYSGWFAAHSIVWTPTKVLGYAEAIQIGSLARPEMNRG
jgi:hypothetical protein